MLYKYITKEYFDNLMLLGSIRVGTLHGYQNEEAGIMVNDSMEGAKRFTGSYAKLNKEMAEKSSSLSRIIGFEEGAEVHHISLSECTIIEPNYFIFSVSDLYSEEEHKKWNAREGYDYCYKINFPNTFFRRLTSALNAVIPVNYIGLFKVHYYNEKYGMDWFDPRESLPAFLLKDHADFGDQSEVRAVWQPTIAPVINPIILSNVPLSNYVELHRSL